MQLSYSIRYVAVLSWQMEEYSKHREHRNYLEESHHAAHYIADDFGMVSAKTKHELVQRAENSMWIPVNYDLQLIRNTGESFTNECEESWERCSEADGRTKT